MFLFCLCPVRSSLDSVLRPFFGVQNASFCVQKASLSVRAGRVRMKIHSAPFFESSSLKTRFSSKNAKILDQKQKRRKKRSLETQGIYKPPKTLWPHWKTMAPRQSRSAYVLLVTDARLRCTPEKLGRPSTEEQNGQWEDGNIHIQERLRGHIGPCSGTYGMGALRLFNLSWIL